LNILLFVLLLAGIGGIGIASLAPQINMLWVQDVGNIEDCICVEDNTVPSPVQIPCPATLQNVDLICTPP